MTIGWPCRSTPCASVSPCPRFGRLHQRRRGRACSDDRRRTRRGREACIAHGLGAGSCTTPRRTSAPDRRGPARALARIAEPPWRPRPCTCGPDDPVWIAARTQRRRHALQALACRHRGRCRPQSRRLGRRQIRWAAICPHAPRAGRRPLGPHARRSARRCSGAPREHRCRSDGLADTDRDLRRHRQAQGCRFQLRVRVLHPRALGDTAESAGGLEWRKSDRDPRHALVERLRPGRFGGLHARKRFRPALPDAHRPARHAGRHSTVSAGSSPKKAPMRSASALISVR